MRRIDANLHAGIRTISPRGGGAIYPAQFRDNLSEMAKTRWKWKVKEPQYNPLALNPTPLQALEFGYNDRLGMLNWVKNDGGFWLGSGPNGQGWTQIIKEITCYTQ